jgi:DNA repair protein SbcC/Rad50
VRVLELSLRNFRVFDEVDLELPARVIGIFGENGAGKSTLMESFLVALYGVRGARTKKNAIRTHGVLADCEIRLVFEHGGQPYEVRRSFSGRNHAPGAELFVGGLQLASGVDDVDAEIQRVLHMDLQVFKASVFAEQKQLDAFSDVTAGRRKEMALRLLGIKPVDEARTAARRESRATMQGAEQLLGAVPDLAALEAELKEAKDAANAGLARAKSAAASVGAAERAAKAARASFERADRLRERVERLTAELQARADQRQQLGMQRDELHSRLEALELELKELPSLEAELSGLEGAADRLEVGRRAVEGVSSLRRLHDRMARLPEPDVAAAAADALGEAETVARGARDDAAGARAAREHEAAQLAAAEHRLDRAAEADPSEPCPTCGRELGDDFPAYLKHCKAEVSAAKRRVSESAKAAAAAERASVTAERRLAEAAAAGEAARKAVQERAAIAEQAEALAGEVASLLEAFGNLEPDVDALQLNVAREREVRDRLSELRVHASHRTQVEQDLAKRTKALAEVESKLAALVEEAEEVGFDAEAHASLRDDLHSAEAVVSEARAEGQSAAAAADETRRMVERLEGRITQARETAEQVGRLRENARVFGRVAALLDGFRDHLVARVGPELSREAEALFRELTDHAYDDLKVDEGDLSILIADGDTYFPIGRFSGSETDLANLALRVAISTHLSRVSGADVGMLVLDEVLGSLDQERKDLLVQAMGRLSGRFHQLFVVTHAEQVKDQFPASIIVKSSGRRRSQAVLV